MVCKTSPLSDKEGEDAGIEAGRRLVLTIKGFDYAFRCCPAGTFTMGSPDDESGRFPDERLHQATLTRGFCPPGSRFHNIGLRLALVSRDV